MKRALVTTLTTFDGVDKVVDDDDTIVLLEEFHTAVRANIAGPTGHQDCLPGSSHFSRHLRYLRVMCFRVSID